MKFRTTLLSVFILLTGCSQEPVEQQTEAHKEGYQIALEKGMGESAARAYAKIYEEEYERSLGDHGLPRPAKGHARIYASIYNEITEGGMDEKAARAYARKYTDAMAKAMLEKRERHYSLAYAKMVAEGKSELYLENFTDGYEGLRLLSGRGDREASAYAIHFADAYVEAVAEGEQDQDVLIMYAFQYAVMRRLGKSHTYAKAYVKAFEEGKKKKGMDVDAAEAYAKKVALQASQQEKKQQKAARQAEK